MFPKNYKHKHSNNLTDPNKSALIQVPSLLRTYFIHFYDNCGKQTHHAHLLPHSAFLAILSTVKKCTNINNWIIKFSSQISTYD
jgi:hypothetical protein